MVSGRYTSSNEINLKSRTFCTPQSNDVLYGRGNGIYSHEGNIFYHSLISRVFDIHGAFLDLKFRKREAKRIFDKVKNLAPQGRFLSQLENNSGRWCEITDKLAVHKIMQAFRDIYMKKRNENKRINKSNGSDPQEKADNVNSKCDENPEEKKSEARKENALFSIPLPSINIQLLNYREGKLIQNKLEQLRKNISLVRTGFDHKLKRKLDQNDLNKIVKRQRFSCPPSSPQVFSTALVSKANQNNINFKTQRNEIGHVHISSQLENKCDSKAHYSNLESGEVFEMGATLVNDEDAMCNEDENKTWERDQLSTSSQELNVCNNTVKIVSSIAKMHLNDTDLKTDESIEIIREIEGLDFKHEGSFISLHGIVSCMCQRVIDLEEQISEQV